MTSRLSSIYPSSHSHDDRRQAYLCAFVDKMLLVFVQLRCRTSSAVFTCIQKQFTIGRKKKVGSNRVRVFCVALVHFPPFWVWSHVQSHVRTYLEGVRAVGPETSVALRRIIIIHKLIRAPPGFDSTALVLVPRSNLDRGPFPLVRIPLPRIISSCSTGDIRRTTHHGTTSKALLGFGCWVVV